MENLTPKQKKAYDQWLELGKRIANGSDVRKETEEQKRKRIEKLKKPENFHLFIEEYFQTDDTKFAPLSWFHKLAIENVFVKRERKHLWEWHREAAKSVFGCIFVPLFMLIRGELNGMILASETEDKAKNLIKDIEAQLRNNKRLISDFGPFNITGSWLQGYFSTGDGIGFWSFGLGQNPAGVRNGFKRPKPWRGR